MERREARAFAIRRGMEVLGLKPPQLAALIQRDANTVRRWADGKTAPSADDLLLVALALGLEPKLLLDPPPVPEYPLDSAYRLAAQEGLRSGRRRVQGREAPRKRRSRPT